jgi:predicted enzyme related to lactoylglutathione lyase
MGIKVAALAVDCRDAKRMADFWTALLGYEVTDVADDGISIAAPDGTGVLVDFLVVPEGKTVKNRLHLDLRPADQAAEIARALTLGATKVNVGQDSTVSWVVLADPEGNEFCILSAAS